MLIQKVDKEISGKAGYSKDYFDKPTKDLIKNCQKLLWLVETEEFEYDTAKTDSILWAIRNAVNKIDI